MSILRSVEILKMKVEKKKSRKSERRNNSNNEWKPSALPLEERCEIFYIVLRGGERECLLQCKRKTE